MSRIQTKKALGEYVAIEELQATGDARKFVAHLPFKREGSIKIETMRWLWKYSGTQEEIDRRAGVDGAEQLKVAQVEAFRRFVESELERAGERLYADESTTMLIRGGLTQ